MNKFIQPGHVLDFTAPGGGVVKDTPLLIGAVVVVPQVTAAAGVKFAGAVEGVFDLPKTVSGTAWTEGKVLYFDSATGSFTTVQSATARRAGVAVLAALDADTVGRVKLVNIAAAVNVA